MSAISQIENFFEKFISLCVSRSWPLATITREDITYVFLTALHIEDCVKKLTFERNCMNEFMSLLRLKLCTGYSEQDFTYNLIQCCLTDPPKFVLKKIINSNVNDDQVEDAFMLFQRIFSEERLTNILSDLMVERASKHTLLSNMGKELPAHKIVEFKSKLYLLQIMACKTNDDILDLLKNCDQSLMDLLVTCLLKDNQKYANGVEKIVAAFTKVMSCKDGSSQTFWESLFNVEKTHFIQICLKYDNLCRMIFEALRDCCRYITSSTNGTSTSVQSSRVKLTTAELVLIMKGIFDNPTLALDFKGYMTDNEFDVSFWSFLEGH